MIYMQTYCKELSDVIVQAGKTVLKSTEQAVTKGRRELKLQSIGRTSSGTPQLCSLVLSTD